MIAAPVALLAATVSAIAAVAGWSRRGEVLRRRGITSAPVALSFPATGALDLEIAATAILRGFEALAAENFVALEHAVQPGLVLHVSAHVVNEIMRDLLSVAIVQSPGGRVLLTAARVAGRVQITVSDDGQATDRAVRASLLRRAEELAALQGATMDIETWTGQGTAAVLRLPAGGAARHEDERAQPSDGTRRSRLPAAEESRGC